MASFKVSKVDGLYYVLFDDNEETTNNINSGEVRTIMEKQEFLSFMQHCVNIVYLIAFSSKDFAKQILEATKNAISSGDFSLFRQSYLAKTSIVYKTSKSTTLYTPCCTVIEDDVLNNINCLKNIIIDLSKYVKILKEFVKFHPDYLRLTTILKNFYLEKNILHYNGDNNDPSENNAYTKSDLNNNNNNNNHDSNKNKKINSKSTDTNNNEDNNNNNNNGSNKPKLTTFEQNILKAFSKNKKINSKSTDTNNNEDNNNNNNNNNNEPDNTLNDDEIYPQWLLNLNDESEYESNNENNNQVFAYNTDVEILDQDTTIIEPIGLSIDTILK